MRIFTKSRYILLHQRTSFTRNVHPERLYKHALYTRHFSIESTTASAVALPEHIKFRMPDLDFADIIAGGKECTLTKYFIEEGDAIKDGTNICEIDTPDLTFTLDSGDIGYVAKIVTPQGSEVLPGQTLILIVPHENDIDPLLNAIDLESQQETLLENADTEKKTVLKEIEHEIQLDAAEILRVLKSAQADGRLTNEKQLKVLKSLARKNDKQLLTAFKGSFINAQADKVNDSTKFDEEYFISNAIDIADEIIETKEQEKREQEKEE